MFSHNLIFWTIFNSALCYYFYNPSTNQILTLSTFKNIPPGYKLIPPPRNWNFSRADRNFHGECTDPGFECDAPYNKSLTFQFECTEEFQCPKNFKCCQHKCFDHKICIYAQLPTRYAPRPTEYPKSLESCEKWPYNCWKPYDYFSTIKFKCNDDRNCPKNFKCCRQNCFLHKICSRAVTYRTEAVTRESKVTGSESLIINSDYYSYGSTEPEEYKVDLEFVAIRTTEDENLTARDISTTTTSSTEITDASDSYSTTDESSLMTKIVSEKDFQVTELEINESTSGATTETLFEVPANIESKKSTADPNAINPEYAPYYYYYGKSNDTDYEEDSDY